MRKILRQQRIDVVHAHVARDYPIVTAAAWGIPDIKVVFTRHLLYPVKHHTLYRRVDGWLAPTSQILRTLDPLKPRRAAVIPNWVDLTKFPFRPHEPHQPVHIGLLGQISPHKGHDDAIAAMGFLGPEFRLLIAGRGEFAYLEKVKQKSLGLPVEFMGVVSPVEFFGKIDVLAVPSWEEPFGIVLLEAMASGIPVVATAGGGPLEIVQSEVHGLLVPPKNPEALAAAIRLMSEDPGLRQTIIEKARRRVAETYEINALVRRIEAFYTGTACSSNG